MQMWYLIPLAFEEGGTGEVTMKNNPTRWIHALERTAHLALLNEKEKAGERGGGMNREKKWWLHKKWVGFAENEVSLGAKQ